MDGILMKTWIDFKTLSINLFSHQIGWSWIYGVTSYCVSQWITLTVLERCSVRAGGRELSNPRGGSHSLLGCRLNEVNEEQK